MSLARPGSAEHFRTFQVERAPFEGRPHGPCPLPGGAAGTAMRIPRLPAAAVPAVLADVASFLKGHFRAAFGAGRVLQIRVGMGRRRSRPLEVAVFQHPGDGVGNGKRMPFF